MLVLLEKNVFIVRLYFFVYYVIGVWGDLALVFSLKIKSFLAPSWLFPGLDSSLFPRLRASRVSLRLHHGLSERCCAIWVLRDDVSGAHVGWCLSEHRAQPHVPSSGRGEREFFQARHRESGEEAEGEAGWAGQPHHRHHHQRRSPFQMCHHTAHPGWAVTGAHVCVCVYVHACV